MSHDPFEHLPEGAKHVMDALSIGTLLGTLASWLPSIAALLTIIWTLIRIFESRTVSRWRGKPDA